MGAEVAGGVPLVFSEAICCPVMAGGMALRCGFKRLEHPTDPVRWAAPHMIHKGVQGWLGWGVVYRRWCSVSQWVDEGIRLYGGRGARRKSMPLVFF